MLLKRCQQSFAAAIWKHFVRQNPLAGSLDLDSLLETRVEVGLEFGAQHIGKFALLGFFSKTPACWRHNWIAKTCLDC